MDLAHLNRRVPKGLKQAFQAINHDPFDMKASGLKILISLYVIGHFLMSIDELMPQDNATMSILDAHKAKAPAPVSCIHKGNDIFMLGNHYGMLQVPMNYPVYGTL